MGFNPRAPCGARLHLLEMQLAECEFQSTRPVRGATSLIALLSVLCYVSIHAPRAGRDPINQTATTGRKEFQSTRPMRGATSYKRDGAAVKKFQSTRPMRGATSLTFLFPPYLICFNPRAPCGARHFADATLITILMFQSTRPMRGATSACAPSSPCLSCFNPRAPCGARPGKV